MKRYFFRLKLSSGDLIEAKAIGEDAEDALNRIFSNEEVRLRIISKFGDHIEVLKVKEISFDPPKPGDYILRPSERDGYMICVDKASSVMVRWKRGAYNATAEVTDLTDELNKMSPGDAASVLRKLGEWLMAFHKKDL